MWRVGEIEKLESQLELEPFADREVLEHREISVHEAGAANQIPACVSKKAVRDIGWRIRSASRVIRDAKSGGIEIFQQSALATWQVGISCQVRAESRLA